MNTLVKYLFITFFNLWLSTAVNAQDFKIKKSDNVETIDGVKYYIHKVEKGQTLYSLSKIYGVLISEIVFANPDAMNGIRPKQELRIPKKRIVGETVKENVEVKPEIEGNFLIHLVKSQETLYKLASDYEVTIEDIRRVNEDHLAEGLKVGTRLRIPIKTIIEEVPSKRGALVPFIGLPYDSITFKEAKKEIYNLAYLLPLFLDINDTIEKRVELNEPNYIHETAINSISFYNGAALALDSLKNKVKVNIMVYDTESDQIKLKEILKKRELKDADFIIGPFYSELFKQAQQYSKAKSIPLLSPLGENDDLLKGYVNTFKLTSTEKTKVQALSNYISDSLCNRNLVLVHHGEENELRKMNWFLDSLKCKKVGDYFEVNLKKDGLDSLKACLSPIETDTNLIVAFTDDQSLVTSLFINLDRITEDYQFTLFGMSSWRDYDNIETDYFHEMDVHIPIDEAINYSDSLVNNFVLLYREKFKNEPNYFSFIGHDITYYIINSLDSKGPLFYETTTNYSWQGLQQNIRFENEDYNSGYANKEVRVVRYNNFELVEVN